MKKLTIVYENIKSREDLLTASQVVASYYDNLIKGKIHSVLNFGKNFHIEVLPEDEDKVIIKAL